MLPPPQNDLLTSRPGGSVANTISDRLSQELVIALVGPVGSGVSTAARYLEEILVSQFGYTVAPVIKPSDIIRAEAHRVGIVPPPSKPLGTYIDQMQTAGNKLREKYGSNYLAEKVVERIVAFRKDNRGYSDQGVLLPGRRAYIIDSIKNLEELELLRSIYGEILCVFGIFAPDDIRTHRLMADGTSSVDVQSILDRDQAEVATFGQMTRKVFVQSDFFICNDRKKEELKRHIARFLDIIFDAGIHTPTRAEDAMYKASAAASNSACMSLQVGAAIVAANGELIAVGWNDVPKFRGGLYTEDDQSIWDDDKKHIDDRDHRCFKWGGEICHNEIRRMKILDGIASKIFRSGYVKKGVSEAKIRALLSGTEVDNLGLVDKRDPEFC